MTASKKPPEDVHPALVKRQFWEAPSGRLHWLKRCSSAAPAAQMQSAKLTWVEWAHHQNKCRCARWSAGPFQRRNGA